MDGEPGGAGVLPARVAVRAGHLELGLDPVVHHLVDDQLVVVPVELDGASEFDKNGQARVRNGDRIWVIDTSGKPVRGEPVTR